MQHLFDCVICERPVTDYHDRNGRDRHIAPICRYCEGHYSERGPGAGAFMDRRITCRLSAIANALSGAAHSIDWSRRYGRACAGFAGASMTKVLIAKLRAEIVVLRDLLETQYRETDKARVEAEKADDEAVELKIELARMRALGTQGEYKLVWNLKRRLDKALAVSRPEHKT